MLLFMIPAYHNDRRKFCKLSLIYLIKQVKHSLVNIPAVQVYLLNSWSRNQTSHWPIISLAKRIVIGIKKVRILWMKRCVPGKRRGKEKGLPEPSHVSKMPFRWAYIRHRLNNVILSHQWLTQLLCETTNILVSLDKILTVYRHGSMCIHRDIFCHR